MTPILAWISTSGPCCTNAVAWRNGILVKWQSKSRHHPGRDLSDRTPYERRGEIWAILRCFQNNERIVENRSTNNEEKSPEKTTDSHAHTRHLLGWNKFLKKIKVFCKRFHLKHQTVVNSKLISNHEKAHQNFWTTQTTKSHTKKRMLTRTIWEITPECTRQSYGKSFGLACQQHYSHSCTHTLDWIFNNE